MYNAKLDIAVASPPDKVWALVGPFASLAQWHPDVTACEESTDESGQRLRTITYKGGQHIVERETSRSDETRGYAYTVVKGKLPVSEFRGELQVVGTSTESRILWSATFAVPEGYPPERAVGIIQAILDGAAPGLKAKLGEL